MYSESNYYSLSQDLLLDSFQLLHKLSNKTCSQLLENILPIEEVQIIEVPQNSLPIVNLNIFKVIWLNKKNIFYISNFNNTSFSKIYFIPATNFKKFEHGFLKCTISNKNYPSLKIREIEIPLDRVMDNEWLLCEFEPINVEITSQLQLQFDVIGTTDRIAVYTNKDLSLYTIIE